MLPVPGLQCLGITIRNLIFAGMNEEIEIIMEETLEKMDGAISHLEVELSKLRAGKATPALLDGITVDYYGVNTPLPQVSNVNTPDAKSIVVQPWEKAMLEPIEKAILAANIGLTPMNNGEIIRINVPPLTEERRVQLVKMVKTEGENAKISVRNARKWANDELKRLQTEGLSEDIQKDSEASVQVQTDDFSKQIDDVVEIKEKDIMTV